MLKHVVICFCVYATDLKIQLLGKNGDTYQKNVTANNDFTEMTEMNTEKKNFQKWLTTPDPDLQTPTFTFFSNKKDLWDLSTKNECLNLPILVSLFASPTENALEITKLVICTVFLFVFEGYVVVHTKWFRFYKRSQWIVGHIDEGEGEAVNLIFPFGWYLLTCICLYVIGAAVTAVLSGTILAYIFYPLEDILSFCQCLELFFHQHPRLRSSLIWIQLYFFHCISSVFAKLLMYIFIFLRNLLVLCVIMLYFLWVFVIKCYSRKFIKNVNSLNKIKTKIWKNSLKTLSKFKFIYYLLEKEFDDDIASEILDFIHPIPEHLWHSKQLENLHCGTTWHCFLKGLVQKTKKEKLHLVEDLHTHWHGESKDLIGSWVNTEGDLCEVESEFINTRHYYSLKITDKLDVTSTHRIKDCSFGSCLKIAPEYQLTLLKDCKKVEWTYRCYKRSRPWYRIEPIRF